jgi:hypothetical protein
MSSTTDATNRWHSQGGQFFLTKKASRPRGELQRRTAGGILTGYGYQPNSF